MDVRVWFACVYYKNVCVCLTEKNDTVLQIPNFYRCVHQQSFAGIEWKNFGTGLK